MHGIYEQMKAGSPRQQAAYEAVQSLNVMNDLNHYQPLVCGTIPIGIDIETSDLDIIMEVEDLQLFEKEVHRLYSANEQFRLKWKVIRGIPVVKANFTYGNFEFELFGQPQSVFNQNAYLHVVIEYSILKSRPEMKQQVIRLKMDGLKTEEAFCELLGISGDPYMGLIRYGIEKEIINQ
ncbi:DUF4269 domain-containing protein [Rossellomorea oryzaecorticis]|uniref:DUF4269 domain-containing protein n=1 Tax=Rossellomorea oryzaecorticis TaxID=1396505 RepID=A0ABU9K5Z3_9BACI